MVKYNKWLLLTRKMPLWLSVVTIACLVFVTFFCSFLSLSSVEGEVGGKRSKYAYVEREYEPLGSDRVWQDTECYPWSAFISYHLYRASSGNQAFAYSKDGSSTTTPIQGGQGATLPENWKWAFSLGIGTQSLHYDWNLNVGYQYFSSNPHHILSPEAGTNLIPLMGISLDGQSVQVAKVSGKLLLNQLDFNADKRFHFQENLAIDTILGLRTTWLENDQTSIYSGGPSLGNYKSIVEQDNRYWGIGPMGGITGKWLLLEDWYFLGAANASLEYTVNRSSYNEKRSDNNNANIYFYERNNYLAPTFALKIGVGAAEYIYGDEARISLELTYDTQYFWNRATFIQAQPFKSPRFTQSNNDVTIQGFAFSVALLY